MGDFFTTELLLFIALGFMAQLIDGALGMAYGLITTTVLLATGTPPAMASASVHTAEIVTTGLASASHVWHKNIDWSLFKRLAPAGVVGGVIGAYILVGLPENLLKFFITLYLLFMAVLITRRILKTEKAEEGSKKERERKLPAAAIGGSGGFCDAIGGGGWGPLVTSTLLARGDHPRRTIGTASLSEFLLTVAVSVTFILTLDVSEYRNVVIGLIIGGAIAAPLAGLLIKVLAPRLLMIMVACVIAILSIYNLVRLGMTVTKAL